MFRRWQEAGVDGVMEVLSPEAEFVVGPDNSAEPDVYRGRDGALRYFAGFDGAIDDVRIELLSVDDVAPGAAIAETRVTGVGVSTRLPFEIGAFITCRVHGARIVRMVAHASLEAARAELASDRA